MKGCQGFDLGEYLSGLCPYVYLRRHREADGRGHQDVVGEEPRVVRGPAPMLQPGHLYGDQMLDKKDQSHRDWARINDSCNLCRFIASFLANI